MLISVIWSCWKAEANWMMAVVPRSIIAFPINELFLSKISDAVPEICWSRSPSLGVTPLTSAHKGSFHSQGAVRPVWETGESYWLRCQQDSHQVSVRG